MRRMSGPHAAGFRWATSVVATVIALSVGLSACGGSSYRYIKSSDDSAYFKVPTKWTAYNTRDLVLAEAQVNEQLGRPQSVDDMRTDKPAASCHNDFRHVSSPSS